MSAAQIAFLVGFTYGWTGFAVWLASCPETPRWREFWLFIPLWLPALCSRRLADWITAVPSAARRP